MSRYIKYIKIYIIIIILSALTVTKCKLISYNIFTLINWHVFVRTYKITV